MSCSRLPSPIKFLPKVFFKKALSHILDKKKGDIVAHQTQAETRNSLLAVCVLLIIVREMPLAHP